MYSIPIVNEKKLCFQDKKDNFKKVFGCEFCFFKCCVTSNPEYCHLSVQSSFYYISYKNTLRTCSYLFQYNYTQAQFYVAEHLRFSRQPHFSCKNSVAQACYGHILHSFYKVHTLKTLNKPRNILNTLKYFWPSAEGNYALISHRREKKNQTNWTNLFVTSFRFSGNLVSF